MKWIHKIQRALRTHHGPQRHRGRPLGNSDFNQAPAPPSMLFDGLMLCSGMLSDRWPQTCPCEERVLHRPRCPNLRFLEFWVNLGESNPRRSHFVSGASLDVRSIDYPCGVGFAATGTFRSIVSLPTPPVKVSGVLPIARQKTISDRRAVSFQV